MSRIQIPVEKFRNREECIRSLMGAGEIINDALLMPVRMSREAAARKSQPSYIENLRSGAKADCFL